MPRRSSPIRSETERARIASPLGILELRAEGGRLVGLAFLPEGEPEAPPVSPLLAVAARQLRAYFAARRAAFTLPLGPRGSAFQKRVWTTLAAVPFGAVISYGELARRIGQPGAARAVGGALGANPLPILIPCHRVVAADGTLGGYSGPPGVKGWLLRHERGRGRPMIAPGLTRE